MRNRSHPLRAVALCLVATCVAHPAEPNDRHPAEPNDRKWIEMEPARAAQAALAPIASGGPRDVRVQIDSPHEDAIFSDEPSAWLSGSIEALGKLRRVDAVVVLDTSASTGREAARLDRVLARVRGENPWAPMPTILDHEIRSVEMLLEELEPKKTRFALVTFAGSEDGAEPDRSKSARTEVALSDRPETLDAGLQRIRRRGPAGRTDMAKGLDQAVRELTGRGASRPDPEATRVIVFFTDGTPTLPHPRDADANERAVFRAAQRAANAGIRVFSFAIGPEALRRPTAAVEMARRTDGVFTPVREPRQLARAVRGTVDFRSAGGELMVRNASLSANADDLRVGADGLFGGRVPLQPGKNHILVRALAGDRVAEATREVHYAPGGASVWTPPPWEMHPVREVTTRRELELGTGQRREIELQVGDGPRKEIDIGIGPAAPAPRGR